MSFGKGSTTTTQQTQPNAAAMASYQDLLSRASSVAQTPYQGYGGELVAGVNPQQTQGISGINQYAGFAQPYISQAGAYANQAARPITAADIQQYQSPYTQQVVGATEAQFNQQNAQQREGVRGNAIAQGALGGDREAIAEATLSGQQQMAEAPIIAGLYNQGYTQAASLAEAAKQREAQAAYSLGNLGVAGQQAGISGAGAQIQGGTLQQQTQQALDAARYQQFIQSLAFPYQQTQWLAGIDTGVGSQMGGTSTTQAPTPSLLSQIAGPVAVGLGLWGSGGSKSSSGGGRIPGFDLGGSVFDEDYVPTATITPGSGAPRPSTQSSGGSGVDIASLAMKFLPMMLAAERGGRIPGFDLGGSVPANLATMPYAGGVGYVPQFAITPGKGAPPPPQAPQPSSAQQMFKDAAGMANFARGRNRTPGDGGPIVDQGPADPITGSFAPEAGFGEGPLYRQGGLVNLPHQNRIEFRRGGFAEGGETDFNDRFNAAYDRPPVQAGFGTGSVIDATDLPPLNENRLGLGRPVDWNPDQNASLAYLQRQNNYRAADAIAGVGNNGESGKYGGLPLEITAGTSHPEAGVGSPLASPMALGFDGGSSPSAGVGATPSQATAPSEGRSGFLNLTPAGRAGLIAAGFGMMASRSPYPGVAIGEGGLRGMEAYSAEKQQEMAGRKVDLEARRLDQQAEMAQKHLQFQTQQLQQQERLHGMMTPYQQAQVEEAKRKQEFEENKPVTVPFGASLVTRKGEPIAQGKTSLLDDDTVHAMAKQYMAGDKTVMQNLGRGAQGAENIVRLRQAIKQEMDAAGVSPEMQAVKMAEYQGMTAGQRALGTRISQIGMAVNEANNMIPIARDASAKVWRTRFVPVNQAIQAYESGTSDPDLAAFGAANFSLVNTYVRAIAPTGVPPDHLREHAYKMLNSVMGPDAYEAVLQQMQKEMGAAQASPEQVRDEFRKIYGSGAAATPATGAPAVSAPTIDPRDSQALRANANNPAARAAIDKKYGAGTADRLLRQP